MTSLTQRLHWPRGRGQRTGARAVWPREPGADPGGAVPGAHACIQQNSEGQGTQQPVREEAPLRARHGPELPWLPRKCWERVMTGPRGQGGRPHQPLPSSGPTGQRALLKAQQTATLTPLPDAGTGRWCPGATPHSSKRGWRNGRDQRGRQGTQAATLTATLRCDADSGELHGGQTPCAVSQSLPPGSTLWAHGARLDGHSAPPHPSHHAEPRPRAVPRVRLL